MSAEPARHALTTWLTGVHLELRAPGRGSLAPVALGGGRRMLPSSTRAAPSPDSPGQDSPGPAAACGVSQAELVGEENSTCSREVFPGRCPPAPTAPPGVDARTSTAQPARPRRWPTWLADLGVSEPTRQLAPGTAAVSLAKSLQPGVPKKSPDVCSRLS